MSGLGECTNRMRQAESEKRTAHATMSWTLSASSCHNIFNVKGSFLILAFVGFWLFWIAGPAFAANPNAMNMKKLVQIAQNFINVSKVVMALFAAIYGTWLFVIMKMGNEGVKKSMIEFLSSTFFAFGGTLIVDALLAMTVGKLVFKTS